jgi:hypothetical protein
MSSKRRNAEDNQISIYDMVLKAGDKLYKDGAVYGEITGESESLFFVVKASSRDKMPIPYQKHNLRNSILLGKFTLDNLNYD